MKVRTGFVSNSSSASFVIKFKSSLSEDELIDLISKSSKWLNKIEKDENVKSPTIARFGRYDPILQRNGKNYLLSTSTTMFNDWTDVAAYNFIRALNEKKIEGLQLITIIQYGEEDDSSNGTRIKFDPNCWEKQQKEKSDRQQDLDEEYLYYLAKIEAKLTEKESIDAAKYGLKNITKI
jgi:hypothetical protein